MKARESRGRTERGAGGGDPQGLADVADQLIHLARDQREISVGDVADKVARRSFGPLLLVFGVIFLTPIGGIPGVPTLFAVIILLSAGQILFGRRHVWLPRFLLRRHMRADRLRRGAEKVRPVLAWTDKLFRPRLGLLTGPAGQLAIAAECVLLALILPALELVPLAAAVPGAAVVAFSLALVTHDGLFALLGHVFVAGTVYLLVTTLLL